MHGNRNITITNKEERLQIHSEITISFGNNGVIYITVYIKTCILGCFNMVYINTCILGCLL